MASSIRRLRKLATIISVGCCTLLSNGCETLSRLTASLDKPTASITSVRLRDLSLESVTLDFDIIATNPYGVALPVTGISYSLQSRGTPFLAGTSAPGDPIPPNDSRTLTLPAKVSLRELVRLVAGVKPGSVVPYQAEIKLALDAPTAGRIELPLNRAGEIPVPTAPEVELTSVSWEKLSIDNASALLKLRIVNKNEFAVDLTRLSYRFDLGGSTVATSSLDHGAAFAPGGSGTLDLRTSFAPKDLGLAAFRMLAGTEARYSLGGVLSVASPFGPIELPFTRSGTAPIRS